jgi:hypothetical protein
MLPVLLPLMLPLSVGGGNGAHRELNGPVEQSCRRSPGPMMGSDPCIPPGNWVTGAITRHARVVDGRSGCASIVPMVRAGRQAARRCTSIRLLLRSGRPSSPTCPPVSCRRGFDPEVLIEGKTRRSRDVGRLGEVVNDGDHRPLLAVSPLFASCERIGVTSLSSRCVGAIGAVALRGSSTRAVSQSMTSLSRYRTWWPIRAKRGPVPFEEFLATQPPIVGAHGDSTLPA